MGLIYEEGKYVEPDQREAKEYFRKGCCSDAPAACQKVGLTRYFDRPFFVLGAGLSSQAPFATELRAYVPFHPEDTWSWYAEVDGYRALGVFPSGMSFRALGYRFLAVSQMATIGAYVAAGPYFAWPPFGDPDRRVDEERRNEEALGGDISTKAVFRFWYLPTLVFTGRASAGTTNFLEFRAALETGPWTEFLAKNLGFGLEYVQRFGTPWSRDLFDERTVFFTVRFWKD